ncbi:diguanylate cyclase domain-containing protein [Acinetobacter sp. YH12054]|uniref:sensor domain-containing diguanylate cyclase n=1 Tax=Acinetobacter sp. YH12054 TaxID=2601056 RepID=UPI0035A19980
MSLQLPCTRLFWVLTFIIFTLAFTVSTAQAQYETAPKSFYLKHQNEVNQIYFTEDTSSLLQGKWLFYPNQFLTSPSSVLVGQTVYLPASFKDITGDSKGFGTYTGHFQIPKQFIGRRIAVLIPNQYGAYRVFLNGDVIVRLGEVGRTEAEQKTENAPRIAYFVAQDEYFTLTIQASSFNSMHGGFENPMRIGIAKTVNRQFQRQMMSIGMVSGAVLGVGLFTILFSVFRGLRGRNSRSNLVFGLFIVFLASHNLFSAPYAYTTFTDINWLWGTRLEYLFTYLASIFFLSYIHLLSRRYLFTLNYQIAMLLLSLNISVTFVSTPEIFQPLATYSFAYVIVVLSNFAYGFYLTLKKKEPYSKLNLIAVIFLCITFLNDFLLMMNLIDSVNLSFISTSLYALLIMFQQSHHYAQQSMHTEQLNNSLLELNSSLDQKVKERTLQLHELNKKLELQIRIDALTGAFNRRALNAEIQRLYSEVRFHSHRTLVFAMLDVDYFKNYNDHYGHLKGDEVLQQIVKTMQNTLPSSAYVARYGGEEFAILMHDVPYAIAQEQLQLVLEAMRNEQLEHVNRGDDKNYVTLSLGMAWMDKQNDFDSIEALMKHADHYLYMAKQAGRDQLKP